MHIPLCYLVQTFLLQSTVIEGCIQFLDPCSLGLLLLVSHAEYEIVLCVSIFHSTITTKLLVWLSTQPTACVVHMEVKNALGDHCETAIQMNIYNVDVFVLSLMIRYSLFLLFYLNWILSERYLNNFSQWYHNCGFA